MRALTAFFSLSLFAAAAQGQLFTENFTRGSDPGPLTPWVIGPGSEAGNWSVTGGALVGGPNVSDSFGFAYVTNSWTDYSVQARVRFSNLNADAGGIGGRLNPNSGGHYAAWISPDGSGTPNSLELVKLQYWGAYEYTNMTWQQMQKVNLPSVGTNWHTLKLTFQGNTIGVYYDSNLVATATDVESNPYLSGGIIAGISTASTGFNLFIDDVVVEALPPKLMALPDNYSVAVNGSLTVPAPGVLNNDVAGNLPNLTAIRLTNPGRGTLTFNSNGGFTYVPTSSFTGIDSFTYQATDGVSNSAPVTVTIDVLPAGNIFYDNFSRFGSGAAFAPWVTGLGDWSLGTGVLLGSGTWADYYSDGYIPGVWGDFSVQTRFQLPTGAWACGISGRLNPLTGERYVANVYPETSPFKPTPALRLIKFHSWGTWSDSYTPMALVSLPSVGTGYHTLKMACYGNTIDVYYDGNLVVHAIDNNVDGIPFYRSGAFGAHMYMYTPNYTATFDDFNASVLPGVNSPPMLPSQADRTVAGLSTLTVTNTGTDLDVPANTLTYSLLNPPAGLAINGNGIITWTPSQAQNGSTNLITTVVTDYNPSATNAQHLSATNAFKVVLNAPQPSVALDSTSLLGESCAPANNAIDPGETVTVSFAFKNTGSGTTTNLVATLLAGNGVVPASGPQTYGALIGGGAPVSQPFTFSATGACGVTINATFQMQDGLLNMGNVTVPFSVGQVATVFTQAFDSVTAPALPSGWTTSATGAESNWVTQTASSSSPPNSAFVPDVANVGTSDLVSPAILLPFGTSQLSFANSYDFEINGSNPNEGYDGGVLDIKIGMNPFTDIVAAGGSFVANGYTMPISSTWSNPIGGRLAWSGTSPGFVTTIVALPASASGQTIQLRWRVGTDNSNGKPGWRIDSVGITGLACCAGTGPSLTPQPNRTISEMTTLVVTNTATDPNTPPSGLTYTLVNPPSNSGINTNGIITFTPSEGQGPGTYTFTTIVSDDSASATNMFGVVVNEVNRAPVLPAQTNRTTIGLATLVATNTATDPDVPANSLSYALAAGPANAAIDANGVITWTPTPAQVPSTNGFTTIVTDFNPAAVNSQNLSATNNFTVIVNAIHNGPSLPAQANRTVNELTSLQVMNTATDGDVPALALTYTLLNPPAGASISINGLITWTPTEGQGPGTNTITTQVIDNGVPPKSSTNSFSVVVNEVNQAPVLPSQTNRTITGLAALAVTNTATDADLPANSLTYVLAAGPTNAAINANGVISWTPTTGQVPSTNTITTIVTDFNPAAAASQHLSATNSFSVVVNAIHNGPSLLSQTNRTLNELTTLQVTNTATDGDIPALSLTYALLNPPAGAAIDANGVITWTPAEGQGPGTNTITTQVSDNGVPSKIATNSFSVVVNEVNQPPVLPTQTNRTISGLAALVVTNTANDPDLPANSLTYSLAEAPANAKIDANGIISWTPTSGQVPSTNAMTTIVTDFNPAAAASQHLSATNSFSVVVNAIHNGPSLASQTNRMINESTMLQVTNTASDGDVPALALTYALLNAPAGAAIDTNGVVTWIPAEGQGPGTNTITTQVTDNGAPSKSATNSFIVIVNEVNQAPILPFQTDRTITGLASLIVTNTASDADLPANGLTYELAEAPANVVIDANGIISWTPTLVQLPSTNAITTIVTDFNPSAVNSQHLSATNSFIVVVHAIHNGPSLPVQTDRTLDELTTLQVTNAATDGDIPVLALTYSLLEAPTGAAIDTNGVITWTPTEDQGPATNTITTEVTDNGVPPKSSTNSFIVVVNEVNQPPVLPLQTNRTIAGLAPLVVTNTATDPDLPVNELTYVMAAGPANATIDTNGVILWTPVRGQVPSTNEITTIVTDFSPSAVNAQHLSATNNFTVVVHPVRHAPVLPDQTNRTITEPITLVVTNTATEDDIPTLPLVYQLAAAPLGAAIDTNGIITWTPNPAQAPSTNYFETVVSDSPDGLGLTATNSFMVYVEGSVTAPGPVIHAITLSNELVNVIWSSVSNHVYRLQYKPDINDSNWTDLFPDVSAEGPTATATDSSGVSTQRFYRVMMLP